jgi:pre-mRNA-processing factor 6
MATEKFSRGWGYKRWGAPPEGYVAGLGRGAVGFVTRADIGGPTQPREDAENINDTNFDEWGGFSGSIFQGKEGDNEDREAEQMFNTVEGYMEGRQNKKRADKLKEKQHMFEKEKINYKAYFSEDKKQLKDVSRVEWESIPES